MEALLSGANNDDFSKERLCEIINVESVDRCFRNIKLGKDLGSDGLNAEHLRYVHPAITVHIVAVSKLLYYWPRS